MNLGGAQRTLGMVTMLSPVYWVLVPSSAANGTLLFDSYGDGWVDRLDVVRVHWLIYCMYESTDQGLQRETLTRLNVRILGLMFQDYDAGQRLCNDGGVDVAQTPLVANGIYTSRISLCAPAKTQPNLQISSVG